MSMTREEIAAQYEVEGNFIRSPGKFEGEHIAAVHFWDEVLNGFGGDDTEDGGQRFDITPADVALFPDLAEYDYVVLHEAESGFVTIVFHTKEDEPPLPPLDTRSTEDVVADMLRENTGTHFLDSGGAYGRSWQRNQGRDFAAEPAAAIEFRVWERNGEKTLDICYSRNVYHFMVDALDYDSVMQRRFERYAARAEFADCGWLEIMEAFAQHVDGAGIYGDGGPMTVNTYNGEDALSQTLQYTFFTLDGEEYALVQVHGGCDVRGGYTAPKAFRMTSELSIMDNARGDIWEETLGAEGWTWTTDDAGSHWYGNSHRVEADMISPAHWAETPDLHKLPVTTDAALKGDGVHVYVDEEDNAAYSPRGYRIVAT